MSVLIKGLEMPETGYMDVRIFRDGTVTIATGTKPYYRELKEEPVRHGKWKSDCMGVLRCSECNAQAPWKYGRDYIDYRWKANYCPNCGARMDEE